MQGIYRRTFKANKMDEVIFKGQTYRSATELARELGKTPNQIFNHLQADTPVIGYEPEYIDYKISREEWLELNERVKKSKCVILIYAPISERYWTKGDIVLIKNEQIRLGGCWFNFDNRYKIAIL